jgi:hypothetical protein
MIINSSTSAEKAASEAAAQRTLLVAAIEAAAEQASQEVAVPHSQSSNERDRPDVAASASDVQ